MKQASLGSFFSITPAKKKLDASTAVRSDAPPAALAAVATPDSAARAPPVRKGKETAAPTAKRSRRKRALDDDDEAFEVELFSSESDGDAASLVDEASDAAPPEVGAPAPVGGGVAAMLKPVESARAIPVDAAWRAAYGVAGLDNVEPLLTAEPAFPFDEKKHQAFVKRLRLQQSGAAAAAEDGGGDGDDDDEASLGSPLAQCTKRPGVKYTPLELQFLAVKEKHPDTVLFVECGYKYKFFAADAVVASRVLGIMCIADKNFYVGSVPTARLDIHMERLVVAGYKAGVVRQTETAALKQGVGSKGLFARQLTDVYTTATYVGDAVVTQSPDAAFMICFMESNVADGGAVKVAMVAVSLRTSDLVYDVYDDDAARSQLETRLEHIQPVELVLPHTEAGALSSQTAARLADWCKKDGSTVRLTRVSDRKAPSPEHARQWVRHTFPANGALQDALAALPDAVAVAVAVLGKYLADFDLQRVMELVDGMRQWSRPASAMALSAETLRNLDLFVNTSTGVAGRGTLFHHLDRTVSAMGSRLLRNWLGNPLLSAGDINARLDAVSVLRGLQSGASAMTGKKRAELADDVHPLTALLMTLAKSGDVEQAIASIYHRRSKPAKFIATLGALQKLVEGAVRAAALGDELGALIGATLRRIGAQDVLPFVKACLVVVDAAAAQKDEWNELFTGSVLTEADDEGVPIGDDVVLRTIAEARAGVEDCERQLLAHLSDVRRLLGVADLSYVSIMGREYLIEVSRANKKAVDRVPDDWQADVHTKKSFRYVTPRVRELLLRLNQYREATVLLSKRRWDAFQEAFAARYAAFRTVVASLATLDVLAALGAVSAGAGYVRPEFVAGTDDDAAQQQLHIVQGRHPVAESLLALGSSFIGNDCSLDRAGTELMIVTGPNMGGKSTYIRGVALAVIMAQMGCFVPADSCRLSVFDAVYTRMGAEDDLAAGRSTFFSELLGTSAILQHATNRSLVIIDELGRGTSTYDGTAIAYATLRHLADTVHCLCFFVTHYPVLGSLALTHRNVGNAHMGYLEGATQDDAITFLYRVRTGLETRSYGLNVARLVFAGQFDDILERAKAESRALEQREQRRRADETRLFERLIAHKDGASLKRLLAETGDAD